MGPVTGQLIVVRLETYVPAQETVQVVPTANVVLVVVDAPHVLAVVTVFDGRGVMK